MKTELNQKTVELRQDLQVYCIKLVKIFTKLKYEKPFSLDEDLEDIQISLGFNFKFTNALEIKQSDLISCLSLCNLISKEFKINELVDFMDLIELKIIENKEKNTLLFDYFNSEFEIEEEAPF